MYKKFLASLLVSFSTLNYGASFDCSNAVSPFPNTICSNPYLSTLDDKLAILYNSTMAASKDPEQLKAEQIKWIVDTSTCGYDYSCIENAYTARIKALSLLSTPQQLQAEQKISPEVDACINRKITSFRKQMGQDALIYFDLLNEYQSDCSANPNSDIQQTQNQGQYNNSENVKTNSYSSDDRNGFFGHLLTYFIYIIFLAPIGIVLFNFYKVTEKKKNFDALYAKYQEDQRNHPIQIDQNGKIISWRQEDGTVMTDLQFLEQVNRDKKTGEYVDSVMRTRANFESTKREVSWAAIINNIFGK